jgi:hypothetical protein
MVYSGASVVGTTSLNPGSSTTPTTVNTAMQDTSGASTALFLCGAKSATTGLTTAPASYTNRTNVTTACGCDVLAVAGFGTVGITVSPTTRWFVLSVEIKVLPPNPYFVAASAAVAAGASGINILMPPVLANDIAVAIAQTSNQAITAPGNFGTFTEIDTQTHMATGTAATAGSVRLAVYWLRCAGTESGNLTFINSSDHIIGQILIFRGCKTSGNPFSDVGTGVESSATSVGGGWQPQMDSQWLNGTSQTPTGNFSTTVANSLVVWIRGHAVDSASSGIGNIQGNFVLTGQTFLSAANVSTATGTGGGFSVGYGASATATLVCDASTNALGFTGASASLYTMMVLALVPPSTGTTFTQSFTPTCSPTAALGPFRTNKLFTPTQTKSALLGPKNLFKLLTATQNRTGLLNKATAHGSFVANLSSSGAFAKGLLYARQFAATFTDAASLARLPQKSLTATLSRSAALTRSYLDAGFTATLSFVGAIRKLSPKNFTATLFPGGGGGASFPTTGCTAYYKLDETTGTRNDSVQINVNDLTDHNSGLTVGGKVGGAYHCVASIPNYLSCADNAAFQMGTGTFSLAAWVKTVTTSTQFIISYGAPLVAGQNGYGIYIASGQLNFVVDGTASAQSDNTSATFNDGAWHLVILTVNRAGNSILLDVDNVNRLTDTSFSSGSVDSSFGFQIGARNGGSFFDGDVDEVGVWKNYILTSGDKAALWNGGAGLTFGAVGGGAPAATLSRKVGKALTAGLSFVGTFAKTFIGAGGTLFTQSLAATLSFTGTFARGWTHLQSFTATLFHGTGGGGGTVNPPPDLFNEGFQGSGTPSGCISGGANINFDYTTSPLVGSQSVHCAAQGYCIVGYPTAIFTVSEIWASFLFRLDAIPTAATDLAVLNKLFTQNGMGLMVMNDGSLFFTDSYGPVYGAFTSSPSVGQTVQIWMHYKYNLDASAFMEASWDVVGNPRPSSGSQYFGGTSPNAYGHADVIDNLQFGITSTAVSDPTAAYTIDNLQVASTDVFSGTSPDLINEGFEGSGTPSPWGGGADFDYTGVVLSGSQSCRVQSGQSATVNMGVGYTEVWQKNVIRFVTLSTAEQIVIADSSTAGTDGLVIFSDGSATMDFSSFSAVGSFVTGTKYYFWSHFKSSNTWEVWWDTVDNRSTAANHLTKVAAAADLQLYLWGASSNELVIDDVQISSTDIFTGGGGGSSGWATLVTQFFAASGHLFTQALSGTLTSTAALSRRTTHLLTATQSFVGALTRRTAHKMTATLSFVGAVTKRTTRFLTATLSFVGVQTASKSFLKSLTATLSFVGAMSPQEILTRAFTATLAFSGSVTRFPQKAFAATLSFLGNLQKRSTRFLTATLSFVGSVTKSSRKLLQATLSFIGTHAFNYIHGGIQYTQSLFATLSFVGTFSEKNVLTRAFTATLNATATLSRSTGKAFAATLAFAASLAKRISRVFSATASLSGALVKIIRDAGFTATLSFVGNLVGAAAHFFTRAFTATLTFSATLTRSKLAQRVFAATLAFSATLRGRTAKVFAATLAFSTAARKAIRKVFAPVLSFAGFIFRGGAVTVLAGWITKCLASIGISGSIASIQKTGSQLTVEKLDESGMKIQVTGSQLTVERTK